MNSKLAGTLVFGCLLGLSLRAGAENPEHAKHLQQKSQSPQNSGGPLAPLQKALEKNSSNSTIKPQVSQGDNSKNAVPAASGGMASGGMMGMMSQMMSQMSGSQASQPMRATASSELPGYAGASHIYHIGATGFFIDHSSMVSFTTAQLSALNSLKEKSVFAQAEADRKVLQAEEELWKQTASDRPDIESIEAKVREIESFKSEKRISFIRSVGESAGILTPEQRAILLGITPIKTPVNPTPSSMDEM